MRSRARVAFYMDSEAWPGGAEVWLSCLASGLPARGWDVRLCLSDRRATDEWAHALRARGVDVVRFRPTREIDRAGAREAARLLAGYEVVHVNKAHPRACLPAIPAARRAGARVVLSTEHVVMAAASRYPLGRWLVERLVRRGNADLDAITVPSDAARREYIENYGAPPAKVVTVRGCVDLARFATAGDVDSVRRGLGFSASQLVAVTVGRLHPGKGLETLLDAVPTVLSRFPAFRLVVVGDGPLRESLARRVEALGVAGLVSMTGRRDDVPALLGAADLFVLPSESESASLTVLEAMAAARPVVATAVGGVPEAVDDGVTGLLVPPGDAPSLAAAVASLLEREDRGAALGRAGRARVVASFSTDRLVEHVADLYERLLGTGA